MLNRRLAIPAGRAGLGNTLKGFITGLSLGSDIKIIPNQNNLMGDFSKILSEKYICHELGDREIFSTYRFLILKSEEEQQQHLPTEFDSRFLLEKFGVFSVKTIDWHYDRQLISDAVYTRIMSAIDSLIWKDKIILEVDKLCQTLEHPALAIAVRTWRAKHERSYSKRPYDTAKYKDAIKKFKSYDLKSVFLSYDNAAAEHDYDDVLDGLKVIKYHKPADISEIEYTIISMLSLAECDYLVCNRISTFAELIFWFSRCSQHVIAVH